MQARIVVESHIEETPRVEQVRGLFDLTPEKTSRVAWDVLLPLEDKPWHVGLIVGPSGCGKSTIARRLWSREMAQSSSLVWSPGRTILRLPPWDGDQGGLWFAVVGGLLLAAILAAALLGP